MWLANRPVQSLLGSVPPRKSWLRWRARAFVGQASERILDCGDGVRLLALVNEPEQSNGRVVMMIHGWEGNADSGYMLSLAPLLLAEGYTVVRLNLRDHGDSHHLNEDLFHSCRLPEVVGAAKAVQTIWADKGLSLVGFSLGGNFCLRVGAEARRAGLSIDKIVAVCPVLNPAQTMQALDGGWHVYQRYFINKWSRSLLKKNAAFPGAFEFGDLGRFDTLLSMTDFLITRFSEYEDLQTYLRGYAIVGERLEELQSQATLLLAADDPVIPVQGLRDMQLPPVARVMQTRLGGHCGYLETLAERSWLDDFVLRELESAR